jgi:molecular chaperone DnaK
MTITGGSALPKDDIERMMRDAQDHADEDKRRREEAEARNVAEALQWQTEKFLAENGDKLPADAKNEVNEALGELRSALGGTDLDKIKSAHEALMTVSQKAGSMLYAQQSAASGGGDDSGAAGAGGTAGTSTDDDVVDAEVIDEEGKK